MLKRGSLELPLSNDSCVTYANKLGIVDERHHQEMINFCDIGQKPYITPPAPSYHPNPKPDNDINAGAITNGTQNVSDVPNRFLNGVSIAENMVSSSSGLVTPPILSGNNDAQHSLPKNIAGLIASRLNVEDRVGRNMITSETPRNSLVTTKDKRPPPEFPPQFGLTQLSPEDMLKSPSSLHKELSTPTPIASLHRRNSPTKSLDHGTPSTVSPPVSLSVLPPPANSKRDIESSVSASSTCDDAEYAAAARAAVDSVVCALVGNKIPSTTAAYDPALVGTGTDRLYSLSLAPVGKPEPIPVTVAANTTVTAIPATNAEISMCLHSLLLSSAARASSEGLVSLTCPTCGVVVPVKQLLQHRTVGEAKHICDTCGKTFVREDKLKRHIMSIHTMQKPHVCPICTKAFSRKDKLKDHLRHHDRAARTFECSQCLSSFVQKSDLNRHVRGVHQGEPGVGINMTVRRRMPGTSPSNGPSKRKSSPAAVTLTSAPAVPQTVTTVSTVISNATKAVSTSRLFGVGSSDANATVTTTVTTTATTTTTTTSVEESAQSLQQLQTYPQHQLLAAAGMVLPYYPTPSGHHQFVAAALSAQKAAAEQQQRQQQQQQPFSQTNQFPSSTPSMMLLTRIAAHASNQAVPALAVVPSVTAIATSTASQQCEAAANLATTQIDQQRMLAQQHQQQYHHPQFAYHHYHQQLLHQQAAQLQAHHYAAADLNYYRQQQLAAQQRVYQQAQGFLLAATAASSNNSGAVRGGGGDATGSLGGGGGGGDGGGGDSAAFFCHPATAVATIEGAVSGTGVVPSAAAAAAATTTNPSTAQQLAQLAAAAHMQQTVTAGGGFQVMANVIAGQQHDQTVAAHQHVGHHPAAAFCAAYQHPYQTTLQQQQQQYQQQAQHQLMLHHANTTYRPVVMTTAAAAAAAAVTTSAQKTIVVQRADNDYQQQLAAFCQQQQQQRHDFVLAYQHHQQRQQQLIQQTMSVATSVEQQR